MFYRYGEHNHVFDDGYRYYGHGMYNESNFVFVDAHVLGSPTLADVNGDGHVEVTSSHTYLELLGVTFIRANTSCCRLL